ncbi:MAG: DSD1 family PLP-dependent enzyme [Vicinamibacterales bacterium]|nr:DSD1 family PLP-dependent enzyme [Vicinamibacterales bacterium]
MSRRHFLAAGAGAASVWIPRPVKGYSAAEMRQQAVNDRIEVGISKWDLDTPCLCVDLDRLDRNLDRMQTTVARNGIASRPHAKTHKCPAIARLQLATGSVGICTAKISEAEVMFEHGIEQVLMTTVNVTPRKIRRAMRLRKRYESFTQAVDTAANARDLSAAATEAGVVADIVVDIDPGGHRTGITAGAPALELAQLVDTLPGLRLRGLLCYDGGAQHVTGFADRRRRALGSLEAAAETAVQMTRAGLDTGIFSGGGTGTYNIDHETSGLTDVQVGSYVFMDAQYLAIGGAEDPEVYTDFETALTVLTTVLNAQYAGRATTDAGAKANTINRPWPVIAGETGMTYTAGSDEFGTIRYEANASRVYAVGDKLELIVSHCDPVVNLYDQLYGVRGDTVEVVWPIAGRGKSI